MTQLSDDCFAHGEELTPVDEALRKLQENLECVADVETLDLKLCLNRYLAADITSSINVPPHANSAVDGYAVYFDDLKSDDETRLPVRGRVAAGHPLDGPQNRGEAVRIFTGATMPHGNGDHVPDTVFMQEDCRLDGDDVIMPAGIKRGSNARAAGEDITSGSVILTAGTRLRPQEIGLAAAIGLTTLAVFKPLRVAIFSTGDELIEPGANQDEGQIFDSNRFTLSSLLTGAGCAVTDLGILPDDLPTIQSALGKAAEDHDLIVTSGGMSVGEEDHIKPAVEALGALHFWRLAIKPGRPVALGQVAGKAFIGLPGNPVAAMVTFLRIAQPVILTLSGAKDIMPRLFKVQAGFDYKKKSGRREFVRTELHSADGGYLSAHRFERDGAGVLSSMVAAEGLVEIPEDITDLSKGDMVDFLPFREVGF